MLATLPKKVFQAISSLKIPEIFTGVTFQSKSDQLSQTKLPSKL